MLSDDEISLADTVETANASDIEEIAEIEEDGFINEEQQELFSACFSCDLKRVKEILKAHPDWNLNELKNRKYQTVLHQLSIISHGFEGEKNAEVAEYLFSRGIVESTLNAIDSRDMTSLKTAASAGSAELVRYFIAKGASTTVCGEEVNAYTWALKSGNVTTAGPLTPNSLKNSRKKSIVVMPTVPAASNGSKNKKK